MFGKRFSISASASALAFAGACSVMLSSSVVIAQGYYQQTGFPGYGRPQVSGLSAAATQPPAFTDTSADATAMSPNSWGESAIRNPYAGYNQTIGSAPTVAFDVAAPAVGQPQPQSISVLTPTPAEPAEGALTNTEYSRSAKQPDRYADASFAAGKEIQIAKPPALPEIEFPAQKEAVSLGEIPFDVPKDSALLDKAPSASFEGVITPDKTGSDATPLQAQTDQPQAPSTQVRGTSAQPFVSQPFVSRPFVSQPFASQSRASHSPASQPVVTQQGYPLFTPAQDQPAYVIDTPQTTPGYFTQPNSLNGNQVVGGYPHLGPTQTQSYLPNFNQGFGTPTYRPNVAFRSGVNTVRNQTILDQGELFDHENKKKEFPPFSEIIAQGRFFGSLELAFLRPHFLGNTGISLDGPTFSESIPFEFDNETAPHVRFGFESKYGPGFELNYFTLNANSNAISQAFDGVSSVTTIASVTGPNRFTQLSADAIGETLNANHSFEIETIGFNVFKDIEFKVSRIGGRFGFTYANIAQSLEASVTDGGGNILDSLDNTTDFRGFGPQLGIDYYRPMGHTPLEFVTSFTGLGLFGRRDQFVNNTTGLVERRFGADEFIAMLDLTSGVQYKKTVADNRAWFARLAFVHQTWLGGGTAVDPTGDFGMKGVTFAVGYNR